MSTGVPDVGEWSRGLACGGQGDVLHQRIEIAYSPVSAAAGLQLAAN
jgi:hypothetical protein